MGRVLRVSAYGPWQKPSLAAGASGYWATAAVAARPLIHDCAPEEVVEGERDKREEALARQAKILEALESG
jgi:hypothetical protein